MVSALTAREALLTAVDAIPDGATVTVRIARPDYYPEGAFSVTGRIHTRWVAGHPTRWVGDTLVQSEDRGERFVDVRVESVVVCEAEVTS